jgi:2',3'-cyclic-nucleotide 2'-phosphodiesterase (5'-nucleotidase family)
MKPKGRRTVALAGLFVAAAWMPCMAVAGRADTIKTEVELTSKDSGSKETTLGNLVADAIREAAKTEIAFIAASSFNEVSLPKGNVNSNDIVKALEYKNDTIAIVKLTGDQVRRALEHGLYLYPKFNSGFLHFSGLTVTINPDGEKGKRIVSVKVDGSALDSGKTYKVAMPSPLANGALAYFKIWTKKEIEKDTDQTLEAAVNSYLNARKTITKGEERLVVKK